MNRENEEVRSNCFEFQFRFPLRLLSNIPRLTSTNFVKPAIHRDTKPSCDVRNEISNSRSYGLRGGRYRLIIDNVSAAAASLSNALRRVAKRTELQVFGALRVDIRMPCRSDVV